MVAKGEHRSVALHLTPRSLEPDRDFTTDVSGPLERVWGCLENEANEKAIIENVKVCRGEKNTNLHGSSHGNTEY